jgi:hypothetical protein
LTNEEARFERTEHLLNLEHSGRQARREFPPEVANKINALSGIERDQRAKEEINALLKKRQKTEKNNTRKSGTKRKITPSPTHTDYSTNEGEWEEPKPEKIQSFREHLVEVEGPMTNSKIFNATRKALRNRSGKRNEETKSRSHKRSKTQSAPNPEVGPLGKIKNLWEKLMDEISKLKGT